MVKKHLKLFAKSLLASNRWSCVTFRYLTSKFLFGFSRILLPFSLRSSKILEIYGSIFSFTPDRVASQISSDFYSLKNHLIIASRAFFEIAFFRGELHKPCLFFERVTFFFPDLFAPWKLLHYCHYYLQSWADLERINGEYEVYREKVLDQVGASQYDVILGDHVTASIGHSQIFYFFKILQTISTTDCPSVALLPSTKDKMSAFYRAVVPDVAAEMVEIKENYRQQPDVGNFVQDSFTFLLTKKYFNYYDGKGRAKFLGNWAASRPKPFSITNSQADQLQQFLSKVGLHKNDWYVVLHVRQTADTQIRNSDIETYYDAIKTVVSNGGWVFRIGDTDMIPLSLNLKNVVDLPFCSIVKPHFLDLYLLSTARFMIGTCSGPSDIPFFFNVPRLITNWPFMSEVFGSSNDLCLPVSYWDHKLARVITLGEQLSSLNYDSEPWIRSQSNILPIFNSSEQINLATKEMLSLTAKHTPGDNFPPIMVNSLANRFKDKIWFGGAIAKSFLDDNPGYLE